MNSIDQASIQSWIDDRPEDGVFRLHSDIYTNPKVFELEQKFIFEKTWVFLGHECQISNPRDYLSTRIGKKEVLVTRDAKGKVHAFLNACRHKGALLTRTETGCSKFLVCPYHGWAYDHTGKNINIKDQKSGCYSEAFAKDDHNLLPLPRMEIYRGLIFGALSEQVPPLAEFLGESKVFLDLAMSQSAQGMEFIPGRIAFRYRGNWKLQLENGTDFYHLTSTHAGFMDIMGRRREGSGNVEARQFDWQKRLVQKGGTFLFDHGHAVVWMDQAEAEKRPIYPAMAEIRDRLGEVSADWMLKVRGVSLFPNMQIADGASLTLRVAHPLDVNLTEVRYYCLAPVGEAPELRAWRLRQFEDFFNVSGLATPDDVVIYEDCQKGFETHRGWLQGAARGIEALQTGGNDASNALGFTPVASVYGNFDMQNETTLHPLYREWARLLSAGIEGEAAYV